MIQSSSLIDTPIDITLHNLTPSQEVTLYAHMHDDSNHLWSSWATFNADSYGTIDLSTQTPTAGTYTTCDSNGLLWSMHTTKPYHSFTKTNLQPLTLHLQAKSNRKVIAESIQTRYIITPNISYTHTQDAGFVGTFFYPSHSSPQPSPCIILLSGSSGTLREPDAALLASHGYCTLALAYFKQPTLPTHLQEIPLEYFHKAISWLQQQPTVNPRLISVMGISKGGELALLLGSTFPEISSVISYSPSAAIFEGLGQPHHSSWSYQGLPLPFIPYTYTDEFLHYARTREQNHEPIAFRSVYLDSFSLPPTKQDTLSTNHDTFSSIEDTLIPVERIQGSVLLISGSDDQMWPSDLFAEKVYLRLKKYHHPYPYQHLNYPDAGHKISFPYLPTTVNQSKVYSYGGSPSGTAHANADSWQQLLSFLRKSTPSLKG